MDFTPKKLKPKKLEPKKKEMKVKIDNRHKKWLMKYFTCSCLSNNFKMGYFVTLYLMAFSYLIYSSLRYINYEEPLYVFPNDCYRDPNQALCSTVNLENCISYGQNFTNGKFVNNTLE